MLILTHAPLLTLPFFWDEIGQFIPASLDLFRTGAFIPHSTVPNVHPPGVMLWLAAFWSIFGYGIAITRIAMLLAAAGGALATFLLAIELSRGSQGLPAFTAVVLVSISPLFFAQSMLAQLDMPAMCFAAFGLLFFLQDRFRASALTCVILVLVKETGIIVPALFGCWLLIERRNSREIRQAFWFLLPVPFLLMWLFALHHATGRWFGSDAFVSYNAFYLLEDGRFLLAFVRRFYYLFIGSGHFIGALTLVWAIRRMPPLKQRAWRIAASFVSAHLLFFSFAGGALLERYLLPVLPVVYIAFAFSFQALLPRTRKLAVIALAVCLLAANFVNPLYSFPFENNLAFVSFVELERSAAAELDGRAGRIATAFPVADALRTPDFGFVHSARIVEEVPEFSAQQIEKLKRDAPDLILVFNRVWDPLHILENASFRRLSAEQYGYEPQLLPEEIAASLSMTRIRRWERRGLWIELLARVSPKL